MNDQQLNLPEMECWEYGSPPTLYDFVQNNFLSKCCRIVIHIFIRLYMRLYHGWNVRNGQMTRFVNSAIIAANHASHLDVLAIQSAFPLSRLNQIRSLAAKDYFFANALIRGMAFFIANTIPLARGAYDSASFGFSRDCLNSGASIILFPEGTRTPCGNIGVFKPGIGIMTVMAEVPILPVYIEGTYESLGKGKWFPRPHRITIVFGEPVSYGSMENRKESWCYIAQDIEAKVKALKEQIESEEP